MASTLYARAYAGANYRLRTFAGGRWAAKCRPTSICILLTELCNARCCHCNIWQNKGREDSPTGEQWKQVLDDLRRWLGPVPVVLTGGEALLKPFAIDLVEHGARIGLLIELLTHGYWDDQSKIEKLALAKPWRITLSLDGIGETHTKVRGRDGFFEKTNRTVDTLVRMRKEHALGCSIRLKTVIMSHNLHDLSAVARFAQANGAEVFYQPIEQNYNTVEDERWWESSPNWPQDTQRATAAVREVIDLKRQGLPIANSYDQLEVMIPYFENPDASRVAMKSHSAHERRGLCAATTMLQIQANGDVRTCAHKPPIGSVKASGVRRIWQSRPPWWDSGCCMTERCSPAEKQALRLVAR